MDPFEPGGMFVADYQKGDTVRAIATGKIGKVVGYQWQAFSRRWLFRLADDVHPYRAGELVRAD